MLMMMLLIAGISCIVSKVRYSAGLAGRESSMHVVRAA